MMIAAIESRPDDGAASVLAVNAKLLEFTWRLLESPVMSEPAKLFVARTSFVLVNLLKKTL